MALKDWKKVKINRFEGTVSYSNYKKDIPDNVTLRFDKDYEKQWELIYGKIGNPKFKRFKTRNQALRFARAYMMRN